MATDKKHIAVYLAPEVEQALIAFCEQKGLKSKKGTMYSAGVNAALAQFFEIDEPLTISSYQVQPRDTRVDVRVRELQAEVKALHQDMQKTQKALAQVSSKLADLADTAKASE